MQRHKVSTHQHQTKPKKTFVTTEYDHPIEKRMVAIGEAIAGVSLPLREAVCVMAMTFSTAIMARTSEESMDVQHNTKDETAGIMHPTPARLRWQTDNSAKIRLSRWIHEKAESRYMLLLLVLTALSLVAVSLSLYLSTSPAQRQLISPPQLHGSPLPPRPQADEIAFDCGKSHAEAVARNCTLDIMSGAWIPAPCYNATAAQEALSPSTAVANLTGTGFLHWFREWEHTSPVPLDELWTLDNLRAYTWQSYHVVHCLYSWEVLTRAITRMRRGEKDVYIHSKLLSEGHTHHCAMVIAANAAETDLYRGTKVELQIGLGECAKLDY